MSLAVSAVVSFLKLVWPAVEPMLLPVVTQVAQQIGAELLARLKAGMLTSKYPFLKGMELKIEAAVTPYLSADAIAAEVAKLAAAV